MKVARSVKSKITCTPRLFVLSSVVALVLSIAIFAGLSSLTHRTDSKLQPKKLMTSACAHNPASHLRLRPDRDVLPVNVVPMKYDLTIKPDMDNFTFEGKVSIE